MLARLQKFAVICLALAMMGFAVSTVLLGFPQWAAAGAIFFVMAYCVTLTFEFVFLYKSFDPLDSLRPTPRQLFRAWLLEAEAVPRIFFWQQPFRSRAIQDWIPAASTGTRRGTVLVHGFVCNRGLWNRWMRRLREEGIPFIAVDMEPVFGSIDDYVPIIDRAIAASAASTGLSPVVVAHSMGGLAVRAWRARSGDGARCHGVVTIGSPHHGTRMARHSAARNAREMRVGSAWLASLEALEKSLSAQRFVCFWGHCDNIVFPSVSATMPDADNRHLEGTPHLHMIHHPAVFEEVLHLVDETDVASN